MTLRILIVMFLFVMHGLKANAVNIGVKDRYVFQRSDVRNLIDKKGEYNLEDIKESTFDKKVNNYLNFGLYLGRIWIRFDLNSLDTSSRILEFKNTLVDDIVLYSFSDGKWVKKGRVGDIHPYRARKSPHRYLHLDINPNGKYLLKIEGRGDPLNLKMRVFTKEGLTDRDYTRQLISGLYFSILFFILLVNIFIYLFFREKRNLFLVAFIAAVMFFQITLVGYGAQLFWGDYPYIQNRMTMWGGIVSVIFLILFIQTFLDLPKIAKRSNKALIVLIVLFTINLFLTISGNSRVLYIAHVMSNVLSLITIVIMLYASFVAYFKKFEAAGFVVISKIVVIISLVFFILNNFGLFNGLLITDISLEIGVAIEVIFLTLAVISSFRLFKHESIGYLKEISQVRIEQNKKLELLIEERTTKISTQKNQLEYTNREIISSIEYAQRIQKVLLPSENVFLTNFADGFVTFLPQNIVSGDFYWQTEIKNKENEVLNVICIGDSNNQGVPGALLGILYMRIIQSAIKQGEVKSAGDILSYISKEINSIFTQNKKIEKHKLSCSICIINKEKHTLNFAGAFSSILHVSDGEIFETKGDEKYLERNLDQSQFTTKTILMKASDRLFIYTDGLNKQLKMCESGLSLKEILLEQSSLTLKHQKDSLNERIGKILAKHQQVDDITIVALTC